MNRNHEGYSDPTASRAIKRMCKELHRKSKAPRKPKKFLAYTINELPGFEEVKKKLG